MMSRREVLYLVDAHSLIFQVFHAIGMMSSPSGLPTNALFGFTRDLLNLRKRKPEYLVCAFDRAEPTFRQEIYADYKANRDEMPNDLQQQLPHIHRMLEAMNVPVVSHARYEADDVVATIAKHAAQKDMDVFLCTSDKDCRQLIDDRVRLYSLRKNQVFGRDELMADWGVTPEQVVDLQTLVGDSVDNVPGVPGIGVKTAAQLLNQLPSARKTCGPRNRSWSGPAASCAWPPMCRSPWTGTPGGCAMWTRRSCWICFRNGAFAAWRPK
jgi:DNA polymerase-1